MKFYYSIIIILFWITNLYSLDDQFKSLTHEKKNQILLYLQYQVTAFEALKSYRRIEDSCSNSKECKELKKLIQSYKTIFENSKNNASKLFYILDNIQQQFINQIMIDSMDKENNFIINVDRLKLIIHFYKTI